MNLILGLILLLAATEVMAKETPSPCVNKGSLTENSEEKELCELEERTSKSPQRENKAATLKKKKKEIYRTDCSECSAEEESCDHCH